MEHRYFSQPRTKRGQLEMLRPLPKNTWCMSGLFVSCTLHITRQKLETTLVECIMNYLMISSPRGEPCIVEQVRHTTCSPSFVKRTSQFNVQTTKRRSASVPLGSLIRNPHNDNWIIPRFLSEIVAQPEKEIHDTHTRRKTNLIPTTIGRC